MREPHAATAFPIVLNDEQLTELGLFCVVWSQIDMLITMLLSHLARAESMDVIAMTGQATTAPRVNMLEKIAKRIRKDEAAKNPTPDEAAKAHDALLLKLVNTCKDMGSLVEKRNHLMHGFWTAFYPPRGGETVGSHFDKFRDKPIMAGALPALTDSAARFSSELLEIFHSLELQRQGVSP